MDFITYIDKMGIDKLANRIDVTSASVYQWKHLLTAPRPIIAHKIITISNGLLDFNDIYKPYVLRKLEVENPNQTSFL